MERVAFLIARTGQRVSCHLNPEDLVVRRAAGLAPRRRGAGFLAGGEGDRPGAVTGGDDALLATGGGRTELDVAVLFDVDLLEPAVRPADVRTLTGPLWGLCENARQPDGSYGPTPARFIWGKAWNVPVMVAAAAERLERFTATGVPRRSWLRLTLVRLERGAEEPLPAGAGGLAEGDVDAEGARVVEVASGGEVPGRLDVVAAAWLGDAGRWRELAEYNGIDDPNALAPGQVVRVPPAGERR